MSSPVFSPKSAREPIALPLTGGNAWMAVTVAFCVLVYYFLGVDQGAWSLFGNDSHIHEFVHDARHFLGFPCH